MNIEDFNNYLSLMSAGKDDEARDFKDKRIPDRLLKYISLTKIKDEDDIEVKESNEKKFKTLENNMIWFSSKDCLNDPYEFSGYTLDKEDFIKAGKSEDVFNEYCKTLEMNGWGITCFSDHDVEYLPMWAYYTNNHLGFCIEYEILNKDCVHEVLYASKRIDASKVIFKLRDLISEEKKGIIEAKTSLRILRENQFVKNIDWEHEREYRIVAPIKDEKGENLPVSKYGLRAKRIIAGISCSGEHIDRLNAISNKIGCENIFLAKRSENNYGMQIERYKT